MAYCETGDLLLGNVPPPNDAVKYVDNGADEIDSILGSLYVTPIVLDEDIPAQRPGFLLLKRINQWLSTGRLMMALDAAGEDDQLHQYAEYLVAQAIKALQEIKDGTISLPGAEPLNPETPRITGPMASFADDESLVEAHKAVFGNPAEQSLVRAVTLPFYGPRSPYTW